MKATFEEGTEIALDSETVALAAGWTEAPEGGCDVFRNGSQVTVSLRVKNAAKSAKLITTLPVEYRPAVAVLDTTGKLEVKTNGEVVSTESLVELETGQTVRFEIVYRAASVSP